MLLARRCLQAMDTPESHPGVGRVGGEPGFSDVQEEGEGRMGGPSENFTGKTDFLKMNDSCLSAS